MKSSKLIYSGSNTDHVCSEPLKALVILGYYITRCPPVLGRERPVLPSHFAYGCVFVFVCVRYVRVCVLVCVLVCLHMCVYVCLYACIWLHVCVLVCVSE